MRTIDADALIEKLRDDAEHMEVEILKLATCAAINDIKHAPTVEPERKKGVWIEHLDYGYIECPFCGSATNCDDQEAEMDLHYCFNCGANNRAKIGGKYETD